MQPGGSQALAFAALVVLAAGCTQAPSRGDVVYEIEGGRNVMLESLGSSALWVEAGNPKMLHLYDSGHTTLFFESNIMAVSSGVGGDSLVALQDGSLVRIRYNHTMEILTKFHGFRPHGSNSEYLILVGNMSRASQFFIVDARSLEVVAAFGRAPPGLSGYVEVMAREEGVFALRRQTNGAQSDVVRMTFSGGITQVQVLGQVQGAFDILQVSDLGFVVGRAGTGLTAIWSEASGSPPRLPGSYAGAAARQWIALGNQTSVHMWTSPSCEVLNISVSLLLDVGGDDTNFWILAGGSSTRLFHEVPPLQCA